MKEIGNIQWTDDDVRDVAKIVRMPECMTLIKKFQEKSRRMNNVQLITGNKFADGVMVGKFQGMLLSINYLLDMKAELCKEVD